MKVSLYVLFSPWLLMLSALAILGTVLAMACAMVGKLLISIA